MQQIEARHKKQQANLRILESALSESALSDNANSFLAGRIREVKSEIEFLADIIESE